MVEFWRSSFVDHGSSLPDAARTEAEGWDGQTFMDSQSLSADPWVAMGAWAVQTKKLKLSVGVTNPLTRHPAVTASSAAALQAISGGRAALGIGRGNSACAYLGYAPVTLPAFRTTLETLQTLLSGGEVPFGRHAPAAEAPSLDSLNLGSRPHSTRLEWLPQGLPKVPLDVAASGPKVIEMSATIADQITFSVGAMPERIKWAIDLARAARKRKGLPEKGISYGAQLIVMCHPDLDALRQAATSIVAPLARFQVMQTAAAGPKTASDERNFETVRHGYDMTQHAIPVTDEKLAHGALSWDFVERFAILGSPDHCIKRLLALNALGIERFAILGPGLYPEPRSDRSLLLTEVMPAVRAAAA